AREERVRLVVAAFAEQERMIVVERDDVVVGGFLAAGGGERQRASEVGLGGAVVAFDRGHAPEVVERERELIGRVGGTGGAVRGVGEGVDGGCDVASARGVEAGRQLPHPGELVERRPFIGRGRDGLGRVGRYV